MRLKASPHDDIKLPLERCSGTAWSDCTAIGGHTSSVTVYVISSACILRLGKVADALERTLFAEPKYLLVYEEIEVLSKNPNSDRLWSPFQWYIVLDVYSAWRWCEIETTCK